MYTERTTNVASQKSKSDIDILTYSRILFLTLYVDVVFQGSPVIVVLWISDWVIKSSDDGSSFGTTKCKENQKRF